MDKKQAVEAYGDTLRLVKDAEARVEAATKLLSDLQTRLDTAAETLQNVFKPSNISGRNNIMVPFGADSVLCVSVSCVKVYKLQSV